MKVVIEVELPGLSNDLRQARLKTGLTPTRIASNADMTTANLYRIEGGEHKRIPLDTLIRLSSALGVDVSDRVRDSVLAQFEKI